MQAVTPASSFFNTRLFFLLAIAISKPVIASDTTDELELADVEVTAPKRNASTQPAPLMAESIAERSLHNAHVNQVSQLNGLLPNFAIQQYGVYKSAYIRGVGGGGRNAGFDARTAVYVDGVNVGPTMALESLLFDIDQIDIAKGPQGYAQGNQSDTGAIFINTQQASALPEARIKFGLGNLDYRETTAVMNMPLAEHISTRIAVRKEIRDGYVTNNSDQQALKDQDNTAARAQLQVQTSEQHRLKLYADYADLSNQNFLAQPTTGMFGQPVQSGNTFSRVYLNTQPIAHTLAQGFSIQSERQLANHAQLEMIVAARDHRHSRQADNDYSANDVLATYYKDRHQLTSQEFRYRSDEQETLRYVSGLYFSQEAQSNDRRAVFGNDMATLIKRPGATILTPFGATFGITAGAVVPLQAKVNTQTQALYANASYEFEPLILHVGGRYQWEQKQLDFSLDGAQSGAFRIGSLNQQQQSMTNHFFSPMLAVSAQPNQKNSLLAKFARTYKNGGWNTDFLNRAQVQDGYAFAPESVNSLEFGWHYAHTAFDLNTTLFVNHYDNYQVFQFSRLGNAQVLQLRNAASVRTQGLEVAALIPINQAWHINTKLAYLDASYLRFSSGGANGTDASGQALPDAPRWSIANTLSYGVHAHALTGKLEASIQHYYQSATYSGISNEPENSQLSKRNVLNTCLNYTTDNQHWLWSVWVRNLTNQQFAVAKGKDFLGNQIAIYNEPRLLGVSGEYRF
ncbi:TonB-dependent receptor [Methylophilus sp. 5]|uniref:TonB-dependent receptor n=1 Tax=Methylophilus sp. 5 TaxID=1112274 RepID=UPI0004B6CE4F|nr:TonB-dependent receptor [Methylophilus sp. 5]